MHIYANSEEVVCTPEHPFYVKNKGFVVAKDLILKDKLQLDDGTQVIIEKIEYETTSEQVQTYNFEVQDYHTYYVTESNVLCHNKCRPTSPEKLSEKFIRQNNIDAHSFKQSYVGKKNIARYDIFKDKTDDLIWLGNKKQNVWIETQESLTDLLRNWRK